MGIKEKLRRGELILGTFCVIPSPAVVEAIGYSGLDFVVIDSEHGPLSVESAESAARAAELANMTPIIRVARNEPDMILKALDIGAHGVQVPHVSTKEGAEKAVEYAKYYPEGRRGFSPFTRAAKYGIGREGYAYKSNEKILVVANVEGTEGIKNLKKISDVPHIDVVFIGPFDLSQSLGKPGDVRAPEVIKLIKDSVRVIKDSGKVCGSFAEDVGYMEILIDAGIQYVTCAVDANLIAESFKNIKDRFNGLIGRKKRMT